MDMWDPYINSVSNHLPEADRKIVFDKYHIAGHLGAAVDRVRGQEHKDPTEDGKDCLIGTKYLWLRNPDNFTDAAWKAFKSLRESTLKTARAWALKESAMSLFDYISDGYLVWAGRSQRCTPFHGEIFLFWALGLVRAG